MLGGENSKYQSTETGKLRVQSPPGCTMLRGVGREWEVRLEECWKDLVLRNVRRKIPKCVIIVYIFTFLKQVLVIADYDHFFLI